MSPPQGGHGLYLGFGPTCKTLHLEPFASEQTEQEQGLATHTQPPGESCSWQQAGAPGTRSACSRSQVLEVPALAPGTGSGAGGPGTVSAYLAQSGFPNYPAQRACTQVASGFCMGPLAVQQTRERPYTERGGAMGALWGLWEISGVGRAGEHQFMSRPFP